MRVPRTATSLLFTALLVAGCGGGSDGEDSGSPTTAPSPGGPTTTAAPQNPAKQAQAQAATLQPGDFPPGWAPQDPVEGSVLYLDMVWDELLRCTGANSGRPEASATSPTFLRGLATQARSRVEYTSPQRAEAISSALAGPKFQDCAVKAFTADADRSKPEGAVPSPSTVSPLQVPPAGQKTMAWRVNVTMNLSELQVPIFQDFLVVFKDDGAVIPLFFLNPGSPFPPDLERTLVEKVVSRA